MKKLLFILLFLTLFGCKPKEDEYLKVSLDDVSFRMNYSDVLKIKEYYDFELEEKIAAETTIKDVELYLNNHYFGLASFTNYKDKERLIDEAKITSFSFYLEDHDYENIYLDDYLLTKSIKKDCENLNGTLIERYGEACLLEIKDNYIILYGDLIDIDIDKLDHLEIITR